MSPEPRISVVAPARDAAAFFDGWLATIRAQAWSPLEVVLVDDGSCDDLCARAAAGPEWLRFLRRPPRGPATARNAGLAAATGELVAFLDLDDLWAPGHLRRLARALRADPEAGIAQGRIRNVCTDAAGRTWYCSRPYRFLNLGACVFRREVLEACGGFDESLRFAEDFDLMARCFERGVRKLPVEEVSLLYRRHEGNMTRGRSIVELGAVRVYKRRLERIRAGEVDPFVARRLRTGFWEYLGQTVPPDEGIREPVAVAGAAP